jgi:hypothetical protein
MRLSSREASAIYEKIHEFQIRTASCGVNVLSVTSRIQSPLLESHKVFSGIVGVYYCQYNPYSGP